MISGYILVKLIPGFEADALSKIRGIPGVKDVNIVFGEWDAIAEIEATTLHTMSRTIIGEVRSIQGVQDTTTLLQGEV